jgi:hypothetical protein
MAPWIFIPLMKTKQHT